MFCFQNCLVLLCESEQFSKAKCFCFVFAVADACFQTQVGQLKHQVEQVEQLFVLSRTSGIHVMNFVLSQTV